MEFRRTRRFSPELRGSLVDPAPRNSPEGESTDLPNRYATSKRTSNHSDNTVSEDVLGPSL
jgi:hypothetical protein